MVIYKDHTYNSIKKKQYYCQGFNIKIGPCARNDKLLKLTIEH